MRNECALNRSICSIFGHTSIINIFCPSPPPRLSCMLIVENSLARHLHILSSFGKGRIKSMSENEYEPYEKTCMGSLDFASSYWSESMNSMKNQIEFSTIMDTDFKKYVDRILKQMPLEVMQKAYIRDGDKDDAQKSIAKLVEAKKDYLGYLTGISNMIAKEQLKAVKETTEMGFSIFGEYLKSFSE